MKKRRRIRSKKSRSNDFKIVVPDVKEQVNFKEAVKSFEAQPDSVKQLDLKQQHSIQLTAPTQTWMADKGSADVIGIDDQQEYAKASKMSREERERDRALKHYREHKKVKGRLRISDDARRLARKNNITVIQAQQYLNRVKELVGKDDYDKIDAEALYDSSLTYQENVKILREKLKGR